MPEPSSLDLAQESQEIWNRNAAFWDEYMGEGNDFHRLLIAPAAERLLDLHGGEAVLEVACGNGNFSRRMADLGARVVACDFSSVFVERARARSAAYGERITYHIVDATAEQQLLSLGQSQAPALGAGEYDAAVCNMALMDMAEIDPLFRALRRLLRPGGRFVFSVMHPCFNSIGTLKTVEEEDREGQIVTRYAIKVWRYITPGAGKGLGIVGQPAPQYYSHRPLSVLLSSAFRAGFVLDALEEPTFSPQAQGRRALSWENFRETPPALVARLRIAPD
jgi:SAM-dependent methyltransferase